MSDETMPKDELQQLQELWKKRIAGGSQRIGQMPVDERPREKLFAKGPLALTDLELMANVLGSGTQSCDVFSLADRMLEVLGLNGAKPDVNEFLKIAGIGPAKAALVAAAIVLFGYRIHPRGFKISKTTDVLPYIRNVSANKQEHFLCLSLNSANEVLATRTVTIGLVDRTYVHPREVFADPITDRATAVILAHNHPSGDVTPSEDDKEITRVMKTAGKLMGIQLLDHIIFSHKDHYSALENGEL